MTSYAMIVLSFPAQGGCFSSSSLISNFVKDIVIQERRKIK